MRSSALYWCRPVKDRARLAFREKVHVQICLLLLLTSFKHANLTIVFDLLSQFFASRRIQPLQSNDHLSSRKFEVMPATDCLESLKDSAGVEGGGPRTMSDPQAQNPTVKVVLEHMIFFNVDILEQPSKCTSCFLVALMMSERRPPYLPSSGSIDPCSAQMVQEC